MEQEGLKCLFCGGDLCWDSDAMAQDTYGDYTGDNVAEIHFLHCLNCGRDYEIADPNEEERCTSYKEYWKYGNKR